MASETVTFIVGIAAAVATLAVGTLAYFKDRRDTRTQLVRDADLVERLAAGDMWHDDLGVHAQIALKLYVYERVQHLAEREAHARQAANALFVLVTAVIGIAVLTSDGDFRWVRAVAMWALSLIAAISVIRYFRFSVALGKRRDALAPPNPPGSAPREPSRAQRLRERSEASRKVAREAWGAYWAAKKSRRPAATLAAAAQTRQSNEDPLAPQSNESEPPML